MVSSWAMTLRVVEEDTIIIACAISSHRESLVPAVAVNVFIARGYVRLGEVGYACECWPQRGAGLKAQWCIMLLLQTQLDAKHGGDD